MKRRTYIVTGGVLIGIASVVGGCLMNSGEPEQTTLSPSPAAGPFMSLAPASAGAAARATSRVLLGAVPDDWSVLSADELPGALAAFLSTDQGRIVALDMVRTPGPVDAEVEAAAEAALSFLGDGSFLANADVGVTVDLLDAAGGWMSAEQGASASSAILAQPRWSNESFAVLAGVCSGLEAMSADPTALSQLVMNWMASNDWQSLSSDAKADLWHWLQDDLVDPGKCSVRWTGSITAPATGLFTFSQRYPSDAGRAFTVSIGGQVVLEPGEDGDTSTPIQMTAGSAVPITIELVNSSADEDASPGAQLIWESASVAKAVVPGSALSPPEGFGGGGSGGPGEPGLKGEYFADAEFLTSVQTRLDAGVDFAWMDCAVAPRRLSEQNSVLDGISVENLSAGGFVRVAGGLDSAAKASFVGALANNSSAVGAMDAADLAATYACSRHVLGDQPVALISAWCAAHTYASSFGPALAWGEGFVTQSVAPLQRIGRAMASGDPDRVTQLRDALVASPGDGCDLSMAMIVACAKSASRALPAWHDDIDAVVDDPEFAGDGDARAGWMLARAFAREVRRDRFAADPTQVSFDEALAAASTESGMLAVLREMVIRFAATDRGARAHALLDGVAGQFSDPAILAEIQSWRASIDELSALFAAHRDIETQAVHNAWVGEVNERLERAIADGDPERIARYQRVWSEIDP